MKIVHLCLSNFFIDHYSYQENMLAKYHVKMGNDVTVIASLVSFNKEGKYCLLPSPTVRMDADGYKVIRLAYKKPLFITRTLRMYKGFYETLSEEKPDVIFAHCLSFADTTVLVKYLKKHPHVRVYGDSHTDFVNSARNSLSLNVLHKIIWRYYAKRLEPYLIKCYGVTPMRCRFLEEVYKINSDIIEFLPMGVDDEAIPTDRAQVRKSVRKELGIPDDAFLIMTGGKIDERKNTHVLLEALKRIGNPNLHLVICGVLTPEMEYLKELFDDHIHYLGWCNAQRVMNCMLAADWACFPGTHSTLWEQAVGVGIPVVLKRWNEMTHLNVNGNCLFVKGEDVGELCQVLMEMLDKDFYASMLHLAKDASVNFLYSDIARKAIDLK